MFSFDRIFTLIQSKDCRRTYPCSVKHVRKHYQGSLSRFCFNRVKSHALVNNICTTLCEVTQLIQPQFVAIIVFCGTQYQLKNWQYEDILFPIDDFTTYEGNSLPVDLHVPKRSNIFLVKPQSKRNWSIQPVERYVPSSQRNNRFQAINHFLYYSKFARYIIFPRIPDRLTTIRSSNECVWITCCVYSFR